MAEEHFVVRYDGEAIRDARIDARDLGMSLVGLADLLKAVQATQDDLKNELPVSLDIHATEEGSFIVDLILVGAGSIWDYTKQVFASPDATAIVNLSSLFMITQGVLRWTAVHGFPRFKSHEVINAEIVRVTLPDGTVTEMSSAVFLAVQSVNVRQAAADTVQPLKRDGIDSLEISKSRHAEPSVVITKANLPNFEALADDDELLSTSVEEVIVNFVGVALDGSGRYRVNDGENEYNAELVDVEFLEAVLGSRVQFAAGDEVAIQVEHERRRGRRRQKVSHRITRVRWIRRPGSQAPVWDETRDRMRG